VEFNSNLPSPSRILGGERELREVSVSFSNDEAPPPLQKFAQKDRFSRYLYNIIFLISSYIFLTRKNKIKHQYNLVQFSFNKSSEIFLLFSLLMNMKIENVLSHTSPSKLAYEFKV